MKIPAGVVVAPAPLRRPVPASAVRPTRYLVWQLCSRGPCVMIVEERSPGWWAVCRDGRCLNHAGVWEIEPAPSQRTYSWLRGHRYADCDTALQSAVLALPAVQAHAAGDHE